MQAKLFRNWSPAVLFDIILSLLFWRWEGGFWVANSVSCPHILCTCPCWWPCSSPPLPNPCLSVVSTHTPAQAPRAVFSPPKFVTVLMTVETCRMKHLDVHVRMTYLVLIINISYFSLQQDLCWGGRGLVHAVSPPPERWQASIYMLSYFVSSEEGKGSSHATRLQASDFGSGSGSGQFCRITNNKTWQAKAELDKLF